MKFGRVNNDVVFRVELSLDAKGLYAILCSLCGTKDYCYPSIGYLMGVTGKSRSTINRLIKELRDHGVIDRVFDPRKQRTVTLNKLTESVQSKQS